MSNKIIIKTSTQAKTEREKREGDKICPECGCKTSTYTDIYRVGFFKIKFIYVYDCIVCGCKWKVEILK
jgi:C4-type Zn-finger protein